MSASSPNPAEGAAPSSTSSGAAWPWPVVVAYALLAALAALVAWDQSHWWGLRADYSFGYLVPFFVAYVVWERWPRWRALWLGQAPEGAPPEAAAPVWRRWGAQAARGPLAAVVSAVATLGLLGAGLAFAVGALMRGMEGPQLPASQLLAVGFAGLLLSTAWLVPGRRAAGDPFSWAERTRWTLLAIFPAFIWLVSAPMLSLLENQLSLFLQRQVANIVVGVFHFLELDVHQQGNVLLLPNGPVGVEEACSGIRSLTGSLFAGSFLAAVFLVRAWPKVLLVGLSMVMAFAMNIVRSLFLTAWAYVYEPKAIEGAVHDITGYAVLGLTSLGLLALLPLFNRPPPEPAEQETVEAERPPTSA